MYIQVIAEVVSLYAKLQMQHISKPIEQFNAEKVHEQPFTFPPQVCLFIHPNKK